MNDALKNRLDACKIDTSIALTAPAGSGKTTVLIARILTLVAVGEDINSIITITYTDNAAAGIKERIIKVAKQIYEEYIELNEDYKRDKFISLRLIFLNSFVKSATDRSDAGVKKELDDFIKSSFAELQETEVVGHDLPRRQILTPAEIYLIVLNNLSNINISTFHGFFYKIINLFPIESGLLPGFGIIDDNESTLIKRNLINTFFLTRLVGRVENNTHKNNGGNEGEFSDLERRLIDFFYVFNDSIVNLQRGIDLILNSVLEKFDLVIYSVILFARHSKLKIDYTDIFNYDIQQILDSEIIEYLFMSEGDDASDFKAVKDNLGDFENLISNSFKSLFENENLENLIDLFVRIIGESKNKEVKKSVELLKQNIEDLALDEGIGYIHKDIRFLMNFYKSIKDGCKRINDFMKLKKAPLILNDNERELIKMLYSVLVSFYQKTNFLNYISFTIIIFKIIREYESIKKSRNVIDFPGIEFKALSLLYSANFQYVEEKLNYKINHLIIDEFQDANRIEFELIKKIMDERLSGMGMSGERQIKGTIFFVGDPNQSIYGFRSSDYKIFNEATSYFKSKVSEGFEIKDVTMEENFRSTKKLIEFQNIIFSNSYFKCLNSSAANVLSGLSENEGLRDTDAFNFHPVILKLYKNSRNIKNSNNGNDYNKKYENYDYNDSEESSVAYEIRRILDTGKRNNILLASHIKIISRKHRGKGWDNLKNALADSDIPFKIYGDKGFYEKKEIDLIMAILKFFFNDKDELSLCKILKSLSDTRCNKKVPLGTLKFVKRGFRKLKVLDEDGKINSLSPFFILKKIYNIFDIVVLYSEDAQAIANIKKLLLIAQNYERATVYEFLRDVQERINSGYKEAEGEVVVLTDDTRSAEDKGKVSLMTIHGAKGLENDIVFIYGTPLNPYNAKNSDVKYKFDIIFEGTRPEFILLNDNLIDNPLRASSATEYDAENGRMSDILGRKREKEIIKEENEFKRLLYVALTRSKFLCYITDEIKDDKKKNKNMRKINDGFDVNIDSSSHIAWSDILCEIGNTDKMMDLVLSLSPGEDSQAENRFENIVSFIKNASIRGQGTHDTFNNNRLIFNYRKIMGTRLDLKNIFKREFNIKNPSDLRDGENYRHIDISVKEEGVVSTYLEDSNKKTLDIGTKPVIRGCWCIKYLR